MARILLVEDNELNQDMLGRRLTRKGHEVVLAVDGEQGVRMALEAAPDLILMDIGLPVMDGWEAIRQIRARETAQRVPVIALTAHALTSDRETSLAVGCDDYDTKPVDFVRLMGKIDALLAARSS